MKVILVLFLAISQITSATARRPPPESERLEEYAKRNYTWPPTYVPNTPGWKALMESRFQQVAEIEDPASRFSGYVQTLYSATVMPNFTEHGFGLGRIPDDLLQEMQQNIREGLDEKECEGSSNTVVGDYPWIIWRPELMDRVAQHCHGYMEEWTGLDLELTSAYGLRLFRNDSHMRMHIDKKGTHSFGIVMHIDKSEDSEEWPFYIEDFHGVTHAVYLTAGDYIMFESTKCLHGRPRVRKGTWYGNVALHFYPKGDWKGKDHALEALYAVPPHWDQQPTTAEHEPLKVGGGMEEVRCDDDWCRTATATKWEGPAKFGYYIDPLNQKHKFEYEHIRAGVDGEL